MFYPHTIAVLRATIKRKFGITMSDPEGLENNAPGYVLWMLDQIEQMEITSQHDALKAARWLGWILHSVESDLKLWDNNASRDLVRVDVQNGDDRPRSK